MEVRPILSTLRRHRTAAALMVLEIAVTCAILCNAIFLIVDRIDRVTVPSGIAEHELVQIRLSNIASRDDQKARLAGDLGLLRRIAGVKSVALVSQVPFSNRSRAGGVNLSPDQPKATLNAALWDIDEHFFETTGVRLVAGRAFAPEEYRDYDEVFGTGAMPQVPVVIVTRRTADKVFPGQDPLGKTIYIWTTPSRIIGVVDELARPNNIVRQPYSVLMPTRQNTGAGYFLLRTDAAQRDAVRIAGVNALMSADRDRVVVKQELLDDVRKDYFRQDAAMAWLLAAICLALLVVTALGIVGLASFWVQQRMPTIGIRRALGATQMQILRYFQTENFLLTSAGIVIGMIGAYAINRLLMAHYELPALPLAYLPVGALVLWGLGQLAVLGPALRAAALPPVAVMRLR
jgi:putative ABC transport system permease protein